MNLFMCVVHWKIWNVTDLFIWNFQSISFVFPCLVDYIIQWLNRTRSFVSKSLCPKVFYVQKFIKILKWKQKIYIYIISKNFCIQNFFSRFQISQKTIINFSALMAVLRWMSAFSNCFTRRKNNFHLRVNFICNANSISKSCHLQRTY